MPNRKITWTKQALRQLNVAINYIRKDSDQNAEKVKEILPNKISGLADDKVVHRQDPHKRNNNGKYLL